MNMEHFSLPLVRGRGPVGPEEVLWWPWEVRQLVQVTQLAGAMAGTSRAQLFDP